MKKQKEWLFAIEWAKATYIQGLWVSTLIGINWTYAPEDRTWSIAIVLFFVTIHFGRVDKDEQQD